MRQQNFLTMKAFIIIFIFGGLLALIYNLLFPADEGLQE